MMRWLVQAILGAGLLLATPAHGSNELMGLSIRDMATDQIQIEKLNEADTAILDAVQPRPIPDAEVWLVKAGRAVVVTLVVDGIIMISTDPRKMEDLNHMLGRTAS